MLAVEVTRLFTLGDLGAVTGPGVKRRNPSATGADTLGQRSLGIEFDLKLVGEKLLRESLVLPDIGRDHFLDLPGIKKHTETLAVDAAIV